MNDSGFCPITGMDRPTIRRDGLLADLCKCVWLLLGFCLGALGAMAAECWRDVIYWITGRK